MHSRTVLDYMLSFTPPVLDQQVVADFIKSHYGLTGSWQSLTGEREQNFKLKTDTDALYTVKIADHNEDRRVLDFQCQALLHIAAVDPSIPVPRVVAADQGVPHMLIKDPSGLEHVIRVLTYLPGMPIGQGPLSSDQLFAVGAMQARVARALRGFYHPHADYLMPWDIKNGLVLSDDIAQPENDALNRITGPILTRYRNDIMPRLKNLRGQVIHNDGHEDNVLKSGPDADGICGVIDFGDMIYAPLVQDLAVLLSSFDGHNADPLDAYCAIIRGYHSVVPLLEDELDVLHDLALIRIILTILLCEYLAKRFAEPPEEMLKFSRRQWRLLQQLAELDPDQVRGRFTEACAQSLPVLPPPPPADLISNEDLMARRQKVLGETLIFYDAPVQIIRGQGTRLYDTAGNEYLDVYNNVPNVGHCHPRVVAALSQQAATLNTHTRYLHRNVVELGERLTATMPEGLEVCIFVCTGSEANDLAMRIARIYTGNFGAMVTDGAYHGNTTLVTELSPAEYPPEQKPDWLALLPPPDTYRGPHRQGENNLGEKYAAYVDEAVAELAANGHQPAALMLDTIFDANGPLLPPPDYMQKAFAKTRAAGGLCIADEVQMGFARSGTHMWGFEAFDVVPDIVTLGKPMGNGHPIAALVTTREIARKFNQQLLYFNTFGGNPVSCAVALAVLDVIEQENLQARALAVSTKIRQGLEALKNKYPLIGHIHGHGLFFGVDLVSDRETRAPAKAEAQWITERMKQKGVLIAVTGTLGNILKLRPPIAFSKADADLLLSVLEETLAEITTRGPAQIAPSERLRSL